MPIGPHGEQRTRWRTLHVAKLLTGEAEEEYVDEAVYNHVT